MNKKPLIIDTDFTKDDIIAIKLLADSDKYDIKAITCYGEWFVETVQFRNSMGLDCPVCWGAMKPLFRPEISENVYGNTSPDTTEKVRIEEKDEQYPWDTIYNTALEADGELEIVTLGPVTNIALTLLRYPQIKPMIKKIVCFAGSGQCAFRTEKRARLEHLGYVWRRWHHYPCGKARTLRRCPGAYYGPARNAPQVQNGACRY